MGKQKGAVKPAAQPSQRGRGEPQAPPEGGPPADDRSRSKPRAAAAEQAAGAPSAIEAAPAADPDVTTTAVANSSLSPEARAGAEAKAST
eukprot:13650987-Alexandrium_andersonii.AAC.1